MNEMRDLRGFDHKRSVQDYIDETPIWRDGTRVAATPMTAMQWRIWWLAAAGKFFEGLVVFMTGVTLPLMAREFGMDAFQHGLVGAASLAGILFGALLLGGLADQFGRKLMFVAEMVIFIIFLALLAVSPSFGWTVVFLFGIGIALGCDYPTAHLVISESIPSVARGRLVLSAFGFQAVGALTGTLLGYLVLSNIEAVSAWRLMYAAAILPAVAVAVARLFVPESASWLLAHGRVEEAQQAAQRLLARSPQYPKSIALSHRHHGHAGGAAHDQGHDRTPAALFKTPHNRRATVLAAVPWFLQDLSTYGIGIFTPTILAAAFGHQTDVGRNLSDLVSADLLASEGAALIDLLLLVGIGAAVALSDRIGRIPLQIAGFVGCAAGLLVAALSTYYSGDRAVTMVVIGFMLFNFMTNLGPNAQTYLIAGEVFPTRIRGMGAGFAAAFAKIGAVLTAFLFPILLADLGTRTLLFVLIAASLLGAVVTWHYRIETRGRSLDDIGV
ncbi:MFS transporter [Xanthobacter aminoxidans]|uniref:MFS transporter n=1 Tax=Xanthobacter aminoxidans TaxID=186280 RepID=UPI002022FB90|nr:MFS transporter [Xanthobacter aminoxidans]MCL8384378.1 MFS transporter [Xanthobacter aminoxidans]